MQFNNINETDMEKRKMILRDFENGLSTLQAKDNIVEKFGDCVGYGERTCIRWYTKFKRGDFDLTVKPRDKTKRDPYKKKSKRSAKTMKVSEVKFKQQDLPIPVSMKMSAEENATVQNLIKSKPGLTICKVPANSGPVVKKQPLSNITMKRVIPSPKRPILFSDIPPTKVVEDTNAKPLQMPKLRPRRPRSKGIEIQLPLSADKRMNPKTLTESHSIGEKSKGSTRAETNKNTLASYPGSKEVTVQFQNMSPEIAKNTVRKNTKAFNKRHTSTPIQLKPLNAMLKIANVAHVESISSEKSKTTDQTIAEPANKRVSLPQTSSLNNQKGIIYLNPQEIFRQSFGSFENSPKKPNPYIKSPQQAQTNYKPLIQPHPILHATLPEKQDSVELCDSDDSGEDILFPKNVCLPAPKIKSDTTYTTYFDMESGEPMHLNATEPILPKFAIAVIEID